MKSMILPVAMLAAVVASAAATAAVQPARPAATLTIRHEAVGCHSWSLNGGSYRAEQTVRLREGQSLRIVNYDASAHRLVKIRGGSVALGDGTELLLRSPNAAAIPMPPNPGEPRVDGSLPQAGTGAMDDWGASATATFEEAGIYELKTIEGAAFQGHDSSSSGPDNALTVRVLVYPPLHHPLP